MKFIDTGLKKKKSGSVYYYRVRAYNGSGNGKWSKSLRAVTKKVKSDTKKQDLETTQDRDGKTDGDGKQGGDETQGSSVTQNDAGTQNDTSSGTDSQESDKERALKERSLKLKKEKLEKLSQPSEEYLSNPAYNHTPKKSSLERGKYLTPYISGADLYCQEHPELKNMHNGTLVNMDAVNKPGKGIFTTNDYQQIPDFSFSQYYMSYTKEELCALFETWEARGYNCDYLERHYLSSPRIDETNIGYPADVWMQYPLWKYQEIIDQADSPFGKMVTFTDCMTEHPYFGCTNEARVNAIAAQAFGLSVRTVFRQWETADFYSDPLNYKVLDRTTTHGFYAMGNAINNYNRTNTVGSHMDQTIAFRHMCILIEYNHIWYAVEHGAIPGSNIHEERTSLINLYENSYYDPENVIENPSLYSCYKQPPKKESRPDPFQVALMSDFGQVMVAAIFIDGYTEFGVEDSDPILLVYRDVNGVRKQVKKEDECDRSEMYTIYTDKNGKQRVVYLSDEETWRDIFGC